MKISGLILAGGKSSRMGAHKGGLTLDGMTFTDIIASELMKITPDLLFSCVESTENAPHNCTKVYDIYENCGPMGGLHAALKKCDADALIVSACDTPFVRAEVYQLLLDNLGDHDGIVAVSEGRQHPLTAVYRKKMADIFEKYLKEGNYRLMRALDEADTVYFDLPSDMANMVKNINTPEDYEKIKA